MLPFPALAVFGVPLVLGALNQWRMLVPCFYALLLTIVWYAIAGRFEGSWSDAVGWVFVFGIVYGAAMTLSLTLGLAGRYAYKRLGPR